MKGGWRYRIVAVGGTVAISAAVIALVNNTTVLAVAAEMPVLGSLPADAPQGSDLYFELLTGTAAFTVAMVPLYKVRPRRILDTILLCQRRVVLAMVALAAIGYFDYTYRLPRLTVLLATPLLLVSLPWWFVWIRRRPVGETERAIIVGDAPDQIQRIIRETDLPLLGFLCPTSVLDIERQTAGTLAVSDGGVNIEGLGRLGGLSRLEDILLDRDIDTVVLAFERPDREEFFGALDTCYEHGIAAKIHRDFADNVLVEDDGGELVNVALEPWDWNDHVVKRTFDVTFAAVGLLLTAPISLLIAIAIKLDDGGPITFTQERTTLFGDQFEVTKFRTLLVDSESATPLEDDERTRTTAVGRVLRQTHLDEIPQLLAVLGGHMTVVGPRAIWTDEEPTLVSKERNWSKRWFVKPGLTGLAQINDVGTTEPDKLIRYDLTYIRNQSFSFDMKILLRELFQVMRDIARLLAKSI